MIKISEDALFVGEFVIMPVTTFKVYYLSSACCCYVLDTKYKVAAHNVLLIFNVKKKKCNVEIMCFSFLLFLFNYLCFPLKS